MKAWAAPAWTRGGHVHERDVGREVSGKRGISGPWLAPSGPPQVTTVETPAHFGIRGREAM